MSASATRPQIHGRSIVLGPEKLHVRGVTYGTFRSADGWSLPPPERVRRGLRGDGRGRDQLRSAPTSRRRCGCWTWRTEHGLKVMVGLAWEQHIAFLDDPSRAAAIAAKVAAQVRACEAHPAILCYAVGNEIPAPIVRWHGKREVERFLERLYWEAKAADPEGLFTYVNYPSTEYLELPFLDLTAFNVFLEDERDLRVLPGAPAEPLRRPAAADHRGRHRQPPQRRGGPGRGAGVAGPPRLRHRRRRRLRLLLDRRVAPRRPRRERLGLRPGRPRAAAEARARGGPRRLRRRALRRRRPAGRGSRWSSAPTTAQRTLRRVPGAAAATLNYPDFEVIVVNDGSSDASAEIARAHGVDLVETEHRGLSHARNAGIARRDRGDRRLPRRRRLSRPRLAPLRRRVAARQRPRRHRRAEHPARRRRPRRRMRRRRARRADPRPDLRPRGRARARLQHGLPQIRAGGDRRLRRALPGRRRRRRRLLAPAGIGPDARLQRRRRGHAPPPRLGPPLPQAAVRLRQGRGAARAQVAEPLQPRRLLALVGPDLRLAAGARPRGGGAMVRYGTWGSGLFQSIYEPAPGTLSSLLAGPRVPAADRGARRASRCSASLWSPLLLAAAGLLRRRCRRSPGGRSSSGWRAHPPVPGRSAPGDASAPRPDRAALPSAAGRAPGRAGCATASRPGAGACARARPGPVRARSRSGAKTGTSPRPASSSCRTRLAAQRWLRPQRRPLRSLGPRPARRPARRGQDPHRGRGARLRPAAAAGEDLAPGLGPAGSPRRSRSPF